MNGTCFYCGQTVTHTDDAPAWSQGWVLERPGHRFMKYLCEAREHTDTPVHEVAGRSTVRIPLDLAERVRPYADADGITVAEWVQRAVARRLRNTVTVNLPPGVDPVAVTAEVERYAAWRGTA